jgi:Zn finger protein HypA/HybF involved in hydrogenase expression
MLVVAGVLALTAVVMFRATMIRQAALLPVAFEHLDHTDVRCVECHHNYQDDTGYDSCYSCHKHDETVALQIESMFHDFCRACHIEKARLGEASGPFRVCVECHNEEGRAAQNFALRKR